jgi:hypothetical protein
MRNAMVAVGLIAAGITANMGVRGPSSSAHDSPDDLSKIPSRASGHSSKFPNDSPLEVLYDYYVPNPPPEAAKKTIKGKIEVTVGDSGEKLFEAKLTAPLEADEQEQYPCRSSLGGLEQKVDTILIATIPNPAKTHLALTFDRQLEAIMLAAQDSGYLFDRYWLPWRIEAEPESTDPEARKKSQSEKHNREMLPGLLLFHKPLPKPLPSTDPETLAIFLVGERPTAGIDRHQFYRASCYVKQLQKKPRGLRILGPTFSGSFDSLDLALTETHENPNDIEVRTGTATVQSYWDKFQDKYSNFNSTIHSGEYTYDLLRATFPPTDRVALLAEDSTAYGQGLQPDSDWALKYKNDAEFFYPREISRLRNAYQHDPALSASQKNADIAAVRRQLQLPLGDSQIGRDTVPQFSAEHTPVTQETDLLQIAESLKRGKFNAVVITGTNVLDILFLSRFIREYCPDLRIIVLGSDLLFVHGTDSLDYTGILVASTYPQFNPQDLWINNPKLPLRPFASDITEGVYNAGLAFLREKSTPFRDYSLRGDRYGYSDQPPVWISVVGTGSFWPIAALKGSDSPLLEENRTPSSQQSDERFHLALPSRLWISLFLGCTALILLYAVICLFLILSKKPLKRWCSDLHPAPDAPGTSPGRWRYHMATTILLLVAYSSLALPAVYLAWRLNSWGWGTMAILAILPLIGLAATATYTLSRCGYSGGTLIKISTATIACVAIVLVGPAIHRDEFRLFFFIRSVNLPSGVAPSLPFLLIMLTLICYAWRNMQRFIFIQERDPYQPYPVPLASCMSASIQESLKRSIFSGARWGYLVIAVWISVMAAAPRFGSLEKGLYNWSFLILLSVSGSCLLGTAYGYVQVWCDLRLFLEDLNLRPIRKAFLVLPSVSTWSPLWQPKARKRSYAIPGRCVETLQMLCRRSPNYYPGMTPAVHELKGQVDSIIRTAANGEREAVAMVSGASRQGNEIAKCLEKVLRNGSWSQGSSETADKLGFEDGSKPDNPDTLAAEAVALRYIAFIRYVMLQLQNQLSFLTVGLILTTVALNCYPFQGASYFRWWLTAVFVIISVVVIKVFAEMSRDATLSRLITDTPDGKGGGEFYFKLLAAGALPLLTVVASHFPGVGRFLFAWVQPAFSALH